MIDFVISVRDKEKWRIQQVVDYLKSDITEKIIIVDYGSKKQVKNIKGAEVVRPINSGTQWNKSHALNIGIKMCKSDYIATTDCDMIIPKYFFEKIKDYLTGKDIFVYSTNVRRINTRKGSFKQKWNWSTRWWKKNNFYPIKSDGGIQLFSRKWIWKVKGYDENFTYWGGMDNDLHLRALFDHIPTIDLGVQLLHQEHKHDKEAHLDPKERDYAQKMRYVKKEYLNYKEENRIIKNKGWGGEFPRIIIGPREDIKLRKKQLIEQKKIESFIKTGKFNKTSLEKKLKKLTKNKNIKVIWPKKKY